MKTISFIGPRLIKGGEIGGFGEQGKEPQKTIISTIDAILKDLGTNYNLITSLQGGVETWAAYSAIKYQIPFYVVLPFENPEAVIPDFARNKYLDLRDKAVSIDYLAKGDFSPDKMRNKDKRLLEADLIYSFYDKDTKEIREAKAAGKTIINPYNKQYVEGVTGKEESTDMIPF